MNIATANRLFELRKKNGFSQETLAEKIGVSRQAVSKWERAEASPDTDNLVLLAQLYGVSLDELLLGGEPPEDEQKEKNSFSSEEDCFRADGEETFQSDADEKEQEREAESYAEDKESAQDYVSFRNGIHVHDKDGSKVDISLRHGVHVYDADGTEVHVGAGGVFVNEKVSGGHIKDHIFKHAHKHSKLNRLTFFPYTMTMILLFIILGVAFNAWYIAWLVFLTIPLFHSAISAIEHRNPHEFAYPVLVAGAFLFIGLFFGVWHPTWILFLTIPLYYGMISMIKGE